jgi:tetratricopeptide (TPR) repeat protein
MRISIKILLLFLAVALAQTAAPDTVKLRNGNEVRGIVIAQDGAALRLATVGGELRITSDTISRLIKDPRGENSILEAEIQIARNGVLRGFQYYVRARNESADPARIAQNIVSNQDSILSEFNKLGATDREAVSQFVASLGDSGDDEYRFFAGQLLFDAGERERAMTFLASLPTQFYEQNAKRKEFAVAFFRNEIKRLLAREKFQDAINRIEALNRIDAALGHSCEVLLYLNWAAKARDEGNYEEALKVYAERLFKVSPPIARERLLFTLEKLKNDAEKSNEYAQAIAVAEKYGPRLAPLEGKAIVASLREGYARHLMQQGDFAGARVVIARYYQDLPQEPKTLLYECDYKQRSGKLAAEDYLGHYELAQFCQKHGMLDEGEAELEKALGASDLSAEQAGLRENAQRELRLLRERKAMQEFADAMQIYERGLYMEALEALLHFEEQFPKSDLLKDAQKIVSLCRTRLESESQRRPYQAEVLYQQAERQFFGGKTAEAVRQLEMIEDKYADTPAGARAAKWKAEIVRRLEIAKLEGRKEPDLDMDKVKVSYSAENIEEEIAKILKATE